MRFPRVVVYAGLAAVVAASVPVGATSLRRASIAELTSTNETVIVGTVVDARSYWNADHTFIFTDVQIASTNVVKGKSPQELTVTLMGGTVGETTTLIVAGPVLEPGKSYVLFLNRETLPGNNLRLTVRDHVQGVFEIRGGRAISQASEHPLVPDVQGQTAAPGGAEGLPLPSLLQSIRDAARTGR